MARWTFDTTAAPPEKKPTINAAELEDVNLNDDDHEQQQQEQAQPNGENSPKKEAAAADPQQQTRKAFQCAIVALLCIIVVAVIFIVRSVKSSNGNDKSVETQSKANVPPTLAPTPPPGLERSDTPSTTSTFPPRSQQPASILSPQWTQMGRKLEWQASASSLLGGGANVAISGNGQRIAGGTPENTGPINSRVRIWEWTGEIWAKAGADFMESTHTVMDFTGNRIVVGKRSDGGVATFHWTDSQWINSGSSLNGFDALEGLSMSADGNRLAVADEGFANSTGQVCIYDWGSSDSWQPLGDCLSGQQSFDGFGSSISLSGDGNRLVVGAPTRGYIKIFEWTNTMWANVFAAVDLKSSSFGHSVAISHDGTTIVAAGWSDAFLSPFASVYGRDAASGQWNNGGNQIVVAQQTADPSKPSLFDIAVRMSFDGSRVCIGYSQSSQGGLDAAGLVQVYDWTGVDWIQQGQDLGGTMNGEHFGRGLAISNDGSRIIVGSECGEGNECVAARVYTLT